MMAGNLPVVPSRASLSASGRAAAPSTVRKAVRSASLARRTTTWPVRSSFQQQTASLRQTMQQNHVGAVLAGGRLGARESTGSRSTPVTGTMQRPSAGTLSNREMNNPGNRSAGNPPSSVQNGNRGGFRPFTPPSNVTRPSFPTSSERTNAGPTNPGSNLGSRNFNSGNMEPQRGVTQSAPASRDGFRPFTPPARNEMSRGEVSAPAARGGSGGTYWNRTAPSMESRGNSSYSGSYGRGASSRPQLDMRQPIVRGPSGGGYPSYGAPRGAPSYSAPRGAPSYSAPRSAPSYGGGGHSAAPSGGGRPSGGGGGGGGHSSGGSGGGHSSGGRR